MTSAIVLNTGVVLAVATLAFSLMLLVVSLVSYRRVGRLKLLVVGGAFAVLAVKGAIHTYRTVSLREADLLLIGLDFAVLAFLYASVAQR